MSQLSRRIQINKSTGKILIEACLDLNPSQLEHIDDSMLMKMSKSHKLDMLAILLLDKKPRRAPKSAPKRRKTGGKGNDGRDAFLVMSSAYYYRTSLKSADIFTSVWKVFEGTF